MLLSLLVVVFAPTPLTPTRWCFAGDNFSGNSGRRVIFTGEPGGGGGGELSVMA